MTSLMKILKIFRRTASDEILREKTFYIDKNHKYDGYQRGIASMVCEFFDKKSFGSEFKIKNILNKELAEELQTPIVRKFNKRKIH